LADEDNLPALPAGRHGGRQGGHGTMRDLFLYRFDDGAGLKGHNFGNLFLTALTNILGNERRAISAASKILRIKGEVIMVSEDNVDLVAEYEDGTVQVGEAKIDEPDERHNGNARITNLKIQPKTKISRRAKEVISGADYIVIGPGDLYTSLICNLVVPGVSREIKSSKTKLIYICNLMTKYGQTADFATCDHVDEVSKYLGKPPDFILVNNKSLPKELLKNYEDEFAFPVKDDLSKSGNFKVIRADLLSPEKIKRKDSDSVKRSLIRHDSEKIATQIVKIIY
jgi:uncharacterized cofD-like protein